MATEKPRKEEPKLEPKKVEKPASRELSDEELDSISEGLKVTGGIIDCAF
jgi:hypothetical protein